MAVSQGTTHTVSAPLMNITG